MARKSTKQPEVGSLVHITFLDHAEGDEPMLFEVFGRLYKKTRWAYSVRSWGYVKDVDRAAGNPDNEHTFTIVKRAVEAIRVIK